MPTWCASWKLGWTTKKKHWVAEAMWWLCQSQSSPPWCCSCFTNQQCHTKTWSPGAAPVSPNFLGSNFTVTVHGYSELQGKFMCHRPEENLEKLHASTYLELPLPYPHWGGRDRAKLWASLGYLLFPRRLSALPGKQIPGSLPHQSRCHGLHVTGRDRTADTGQVIPSLVHFPASELPLVGKNE